MKKKVVIPIVSVLAVASLVFFNFPSHAEDNVEDLKKQIELLQKRVDELEGNPSQNNDDSWGYFGNRSNRAWDPFAEMQQMQEQMNQMFQHSFNNRGWSNGGVFSNRLHFDNDFDLKETKEGYEIIFDMAGFDKDKVDIQIDEHSITVKGEHTRQETSEKDNSYFSSQAYGSFMRTIPLPIDADTTSVKTEKEGDKLVIRMPKKTT